jgi:2-oxo-4-hydroxy-4-carboxy-5-ureidoimidazoline decarboxylase
MKSIITLASLLTLTHSEIVTYLKGIYENSSWVAEGLVIRPKDVDGKELPIESVSTVGDLWRAMKYIVDTAPYEQKLELLRAHPDLCCEKLESLSASSQLEQTSSGLQSLTDEEKVRFATMNAQYKSKFGFPFILAVRHATKYTVLAALEGRLRHEVDVEFPAALMQVHKIAWMRLLQAIHIDNPKGFLTCHVLDTANGVPAANMRVQLHRLRPKEHAGFLAEYRTNDDGRLPSGPALKGTDFIVGTYEWTFFVGDYFASRGNYISGVPFLDQVPIQFGLDDPDEHYHVPILVSPWSYSTYRGS